MVSRDPGDSDGRTSFRLLSFLCILVQLPLIMFILLFSFVSEDTTIPELIITRLCLHHMATLILSILQDRESP